jgi:hypothetical protein
MTPVWATSKAPSTPVAATGTPGNFYIAFSFGPTIRATMRQSYLGYLLITGRVEEANELLALQGMDKI